MVIYRYRAACIRSRIIPLSPEFVEYIREDGIILADDEDGGGTSPGDDEWHSTTPSDGPQPRIPSADDDDDDTDSDEEDEPPRPPPNQRFPELHQTIKDKIAELGGAVAPKLNWSAPKDATWISPHQNTIKCTSPNDVYLLLKSSNFITHDLEHAFDNCTSPPPPPPASSHPSAPLSSSSPSSSPLPLSSSSSPNNVTPPRPQPQPQPRPQFRPVLVLRSYFNPHPAMEFRCFSKHRNLVAISQRDLRHYEFLRPLRAAVVARVARLFNHRLRYTFPEGSFVFDVYIPEGGGDDDDGDGPLGRARLIDINPWAPQTDSLLFGWRELLDLEVPGPVLGTSSEEEGEETDGEGVDGEEEEEDFVPELRLVEKDDQSAFNLGAPQYSAHKLPREVVDASLAGEGGMRDFARKWREMVEYRAHVADWETGGGGGGGGGGDGAGNRGQS